MKKYTIKIYAYGDVKVIKDVINIELVACLLVLHKARADVVIHLDHLEKIEVDYYD